MESIDSSSTKKALAVNLDDSIYGTFAEIGAGQEVARHFFLAGRASHTIAKTMSAYDMTFSDAIYGKEGRYVCESRLIKMLDHEYSLLIERLEKQRGANTRFFAFADTVATQSLTDEDSRRSHGWMGIRFQHQPGAEPCDIILHVKLWDRGRIQQQDALGVLGVNLLHGAYFLNSDPKKLIRSLVDSLGTRRIEVDMLRFSGPCFENLDHRDLALELVANGLTEAVVLSPKGEVLLASEVLFKHDVLVQRGTFRPVTNVNIEILERGLKQIKSDKACQDKNPVVLMELTMHPETEGGTLDRKDFLDRAEALGALNYHVLISKFVLFYQLKRYLREATSGLIGMLVGASHLEKIFDPKYYTELPGKTLEGFARLFDEKAKFYVFPFKDKLICSTAKTFNPHSSLRHLYKHFLDSQQIEDIAGCEDVDTSIHARDVRAMLDSGSKEWEKLVPEKVKDLINKRGLFRNKTS